MITDEMIAYESGHSASDRAWSKWVVRAERLLGVTSLDGDQDVDGYSLDAAYVAFEKHWTPDAYVSRVQRPTCPTCKQPRYLVGCTDCTNVEAR